MRKLLGAMVWLLLLVVAFRLGASSRAPGGLAAPLGTSFAAALEHRDPLSRSFAISRSLHDLDAQGMGDVVAAVEAAGHRFDRQEYRLLMAAWVRLEPDQAFMWASSRPGKLEARAVEAALEALGYINPARARYFLDSIEDRNRSDDLHLQMALGWARSELRDELSNYLAKQPRSVYRQRAVAALASQILMDGPDELMEWVEALEADPSTAFKRTAFQQAVNALAQVDHVQAARWVDEHVGRVYALRAPNVVGRHWAEKDPGAAISWLVSLPPASTEQDRTKEMFTHWLSRNRSAAEAWIRAEPPSKELDPLVRVIISDYFDRRPAAAMDWAHLLDDPVVRMRVLTLAGRSWYRKDPDAFLAWLPESGLDAQARDLILNTPMMQQRPGPGPGPREREWTQP